MEVSQMSDGLVKIIEEYAKPVATPPSVTSREIARKAVEFGSPDRIPYSFITPFQSDFFECAILRALFGNGRRDKPKNRGDVYYDEWGVGQKVTGREWDHAFDYPLKDLQKLDGYQFPDLAAPKIYTQQKAFIQKANEAGKYIIGYDPVMMFERVRSLMGFEAMMVAPYTQPDGLKELLDRLTDLTIAIIEAWAGIGGVHGYMTWEDWGLQTSLQMKIETFRRFYKPCYARIVEAVHNHGMHYIWHNCGQILDMIPDMIEIGVDVVQLDQPRLMGHEKLTGEFGGKICFWNTVDIQWSVLEDITEDDLRHEVAEMIETYNRFEGGFMARHYPQPRDINLSAERNRVIAEAFFEYGCS
jgi:uroporphyrinogen decarboxylase